MVWFNTKKSGLSLVEALLVAGLIGLFFAGLLGGFRGIFDLIVDSKARQTASTVALKTMELARALNYDLVGTIGGIPAGPLPQVSTSTENGIDFTTEVLIEYIDDPADGLDVLDSNGVTTDYKRVVITVSWQNRRNQTQVIQLTSNISPPGIETDVGGGSLRVNVFDSSFTPVAGATVRLVNASTDPAINTTRTTNANGVALFSGAPTASGYEIEVTRTGYTTDQTHVAAGSLVNPITPPVTIVEGNLTTATFYIDQVSQLAIQTLSNQSTVEDTISVTNSSDVASEDSVSITASGITLVDVAGDYVSNGYVQFLPLAPSPIVGWQVLTITGMYPLGTTAIVQVYDGSNPTDLISDTDLPGNSAGFTAAYIPLEILDASVYPSLSIRVRLETIDTAVSPTLTGVSLIHTATETVLPGVTLTFAGNRSLGTDASSNPVLRNDFSTVTNGMGTSLLSNLEWDFYTITPTGYVIEDACPSAPLAVNAGDSIALRLILRSTVPYSTRVQVTNSIGTPISNATITMSRPSFNETNNASACGQAFFTLPSANTYTIEIAAPGYVAETIAGFVVSGNESVVIVLTPS